jgi:DNA-binding transcriptional LysR family regulator
VGGTCIDSNVVLRACDTAGFEPRIGFESEDYSAIMGMVASGMGVALIPSLALVSARDDIAIRPLRDARPVRRVRAAIAVDRPSALVDALVDTLRVAGHDRPWAAGRRLALAAA